MIALKKEVPVKKERYDTGRSGRYGRSGGYRSERSDRPERQDRSDRYGSAAVKAAEISVSEPEEL